MKVHLLTIIVTSCTIYFAGHPQSSTSQSHQREQHDCKFILSLHCCCNMSTIGTAELELAFSSSMGLQDGDHVSYGPQMPDTPGTPSLLFSTPLLARVGLSFNTAFKIVVCASCGIAWKPMKIVGHLKKAHQIQIKKGDEEEIMSLIHIHGITDDTPIATPMPKLAPVELIKVHEDGYCCNICDYCCRNIRTFDNHWSTNHRNIHTAHSDRFHKGDMQTFFDPVPIRFFEVSTYLQHIPIGSPFDIYMKNELPKQPAFQPTIPLKEREIPPFLHVTQWHTHLADYVTDQNKRLALRDIVQLPKGLNNNDLHGVVIKYMQDVCKKASELAYQLRCLLMECPR